MFFDDYNKNKHTVNLGNKTLSSKDDFLKKIKEDERKEKEKIFIEQKKNVLSPDRIWVIFLLNVCDSWL